MPRKILFSGRQYLSKQILCLTGILLISAQTEFTAVLWAQTTFTLKSAPADLNVYLDNELIKPVSSSAGHRIFRIANSGTLRFSAPGYRSIEHQSGSLPVKNYITITNNVRFVQNNITGIKLEKEDGIAALVGEYQTGTQPKSAYFSPDGQRIFVPLLNQHGIDVFRQAEGKLEYETRLTVPNSKAVGFVEAMCDASRRELWISNMEENKVHIFNLDTLEYKTSLNTGGVLPKVITQSPDGKITAVSNWVSQNLSIFDSETKQLLRRISVGGTPRGMAFSPDSTLIYTAIYDLPQVAVVSLTENKVIRRFQFHQRTGAARHIIYRDEKLYVSDMFQGSVTILNASNGAVLRSSGRIDNNQNVNTIVMSPDGRYIFVSFRGRNNPEDYTRPGPDFGAVYILNADDLSILEKIWGRNQPTGLAVSPDGKQLVFTDFLDANLELYRLP